MDTAERTAARGSSTVYDGFISYSHAADDLLAPRLQSALQRFAKPWWKRRALRIFRDESSLSANPHLWSSITEALDESGWFVLLLSPDAAQSSWVNQEIEYWKEHKDPSRILPVLTDGTFEWSGGDVAGTAVPEQLQGAFTEEPRWVDMRFARDETDLDLKDPRFADAVADIASALRDIPKDELASEEVKQHRRTIRTAWGAAALVGLLAVTATMLAIQSSTNADRAEAEAARAEQEAERAEQEAERAEGNAQAEAEARLDAEAQARLARSRELGAAAIEAVEQDPGLARILAVAAVEELSPDQEVPPAAVNALWRSLAQDRLVKEIQTGGSGFTTIDLSGSGDRLIVTNEESLTIHSYAVPEGTLEWSSEFGEGWILGLAAVSDDGSKVATSVLVEADSDESNRVVVLDGGSGDEISVIDFPECTTVTPWGWSKDGTYFLASNGFEPCPRPNAPSGTWVEVFDGTTLEATALIPSDEPFLMSVGFDDANNVYVFGVGSPVHVYSAGDFSLLRVLDEAIGLGDVAPDGSFVAVFTNFGDRLAAIFDAETGAQVDALPIPARYSTPYPFRFSADGSSVVVPTVGNRTFVWGAGNGVEIAALPSGPTDSAAISPDGVNVYTSHPDGIVRFWSLDSSTVNTEVAGSLGGYSWVNGNSFRFGPTLGSVQTIDLTRECEIFCSAVQFFDLATGELVGTPVEGLNSQPLPDGRVAIAQYKDDWIVHDPETGESEVFLRCQENEFGDCPEPGEAGPVYDEVWLSLDGDEIGARRINDDDTETLLIVDPATGDGVEDTTFSMQMGGFSSDWVIGSTERDLVAISRGTTEEIFKTESSVDQWELSPTGDHLLVKTFEQEFLLVELGTWGTSRFSLDVGQVRGLGFGPGDESVAIADEDNLFIYDFAQGIATQTIPISGVSDIHWLDPETIVIGTNTGLWARVSLDVDDLVDAAKDPAVPRQFTAQECATYDIEPCPATDEDE